LTDFYPVTARRKALGLYPVAARLDVSGFLFIGGAARHSRFPDRFRRDYRHRDTNPVVARL
jgi:hypothetical protein